MITTLLLALSVAVALVDGRPQENFSFPENSARPPRFPPQRPRPGFRPQIPSQQFLQGTQQFPQGTQQFPQGTQQFPQANQQFSQGNQQQPSQNNLFPTASPFQQNGLDSTTADTSDMTTTRIPPRDPGNRIVYILPPNCNCPFTNQYSPVCGTDGQTYGNFAILQCNKQCGVDVDVYLMGACGRNNG